MSGEAFSEFNPALCCEHEWQRKPIDEYQLWCHKCDAVAEKDKRGKIVAYRYPATSYLE